jgi:predicted ATPase
MILESPLVREENSQYVLTGPLPALAIPSTLQDTLMARLDQLTPVKAVAQLGATIGREFPYELLAAVSPLDASVLQHGLAQLVDAELLYQRGHLPQAQYIFKHALIRDAAYQSLLRSTRQQYHQQIAQVIEARLPGICETQPELLPHHYTEAGLSAHAIPYWQRAGEHSNARSAYVEAVAHCRKGLELLKTLPDTPERTRQELDLQMILARALQVTKGFAAPDVEQVYARARALCQVVGDTPQFFRVLSGLRNSYLLQGKFQEAREPAEQLLSWAKRQQDPVLLAQGYFVMGHLLLWLGDLTPAQAYLEQQKALYDFQQDRSRTSVHVRDSVGRLNHAALLLWLLGYPDQALERINDALTLSPEHAHPHNLAFTLCYAAQLHQFRWEGPLALERAEAAITLSSEHGFALYVARGTALQGWALAVQGQGEAGIAQIHRGMTAWRATGAELQRPYWLALLAEACANAGQLDGGLRALTEALEAVASTGERWWAAELHRLQRRLAAVPGRP